MCTAVLPLRLLKDSSCGYQPAPGLFLLLLVAPAFPPSGPTPCRAAACPSTGTAILHTGPWGRLGCPVSPSAG